MAASVGHTAGSPFGPEDPRSCEERLEDLHRIYEQVSNINRRQTDSALRDDLVRLLLQWRAGREDLVQFDPVPDPAGDVVLVVRDELLVRAAALEDSRARALIASYGLEAQRIECLDNRLVRLVAPRTRGSALVTLSGALRARGLNTSLNYVTPMGPVAKGLGGPELSAAQRRPRRPEPGAGEPIRVAVIDTGVAERERSDGWLTGLVRPDNIDLLDELPADGYLDLGAGHGTFVAGVVQQVAPGADIAVYRALDSDGIGNKVDIACAMVRAVRDGAQILNLSFGLEALQDRPPLAFEVALELIDEIAEETGHEVLIIAAAGNFGRARPCWPAAFCEVVAVAGLTPRLAPAPWSSRGPWVTCSTLGEGVWSTYVAGTESPIVDPDPEVFEPDAWALWTGTSFAAPQVAGAVAKIAQEQGSTPRRALQTLLAGRPELPEYGRTVRILPET